jgi:hypothetical protein
MPRRRRSRTQKKVITAAMNASRISPVVIASLRTRSQQPAQGSGQPLNTSIRPAGCHGRYAYPARPARWAHRADATVAELAQHGDLLIQELNPVPGQLGGLVLARGADATER